MKQRIVRKKEVNHNGHGQVEEPEDDPVLHRVHVDEIHTRQVGTEVILGIVYRDRDGNRHVRKYTCRLD